MTSAWIFGGLLGLVEFGLLVSRPMRRFVRPRRRLAVSPGQRVLACASVAEFGNVPLVGLTASESDALVHLGVKLR